MPYMIKGPVPTRAIGKCPWCERENAILHLLAAIIDGQLGGDYVCARCLLALDEMTDTKRGLRSNPEVEVSGDG